MRRKYRRPQSYSIHVDDGNRDLRIFLSSLSIGMCVGAFLVFFFYALPKEHAALAPAPAPVATPVAECKPDLTRLDELETRLNTCRADLRRVQQFVPAVTPAPSPLIPPLPKPPPGRAEAPVASPPVVVEPVAAIPAAVPLTEPVPPAMLVWPQNWPKKPRPNPPRPAGSAETASAPAVTPAATASVAAGADAPPRATSVTLDVGQEATVSEGYQLRLIGISRRNSGRYCILGGNGMASARIASGQKKQVSWRNQKVTLVPTVKDSNTCQIALQPG